MLETKSNWNSKKLNHSFKQPSIEDMVAITQSSRNWWRKKELEYGSWIWEHNSVCCVSRQPWSSSHTKPINASKKEQQESRMERQFRNGTAVKETKSREFNTLNSWHQLTYKEGAIFCTSRQLNQMEQQTTINRKRQSYVHIIWNDHQ